MNDKSDPCPQPQMQPLALCRFVARPATQVEYAGPAIGHQRPEKRMLAPGVQQQLLSCFRDDDDAPELMATRLRERSWDFMVPVEARAEKNTGTGYTGDILGMTSPPRLCRRNAGAAILALAWLHCSLVYHALHFRRGSGFWANVGDEYIPVSMLHLMAAELDLTPGSLRTLLQPFIIADMVIAVDTSPVTCWAS